MSKIGIVITTFLRDELLMKSVESLIKNKPENSIVIIVDQGKMTKEKEDWVLKYCTFNGTSKSSAIPFFSYTPIYYHNVAFNSGLSFCRNFGMYIAKDLGCDYVLMGSDSFLFNESLKNIKNIPNDYDLIGFELSGCICGWEAKLELTENCFLLDFIDKNLSEKTTNIYDCDIVRNFFLAKTDSLIEVQWDNMLKLGEHEDFFWRYKQAGYKVGWTNLVNAEKMNPRPDKYAEYRKENFRDGINYLREKYGISGWVEYKNLERAKS